MAAKAYNPTDSPLVLDDGSVLAGREHGEVDTDSDRVLEAVLAERLVLTNPATHERALARAADRRTERQAAATAALTDVPEPEDDPDGEESVYDPASYGVKSTTDSPKGA